MDWQSDEYRARYWEEKKLQHQRGQDFINAVKPGDVVRLERYTITNSSPYSLSDYADIRTTQTVKIYAVNKSDSFRYFTTNMGDTILADSVIAWRKLPQQQTLGL